MRVEINVLLFFNDQPTEKVDGYIRIDEEHDEEEILEEMAGFIETAAQDHLDTFTVGVAQVVVGEEDMYHVSFANPNREDENDLCNIVVPDEMTIH